MSKKDLSKKDQAFLARARLKTMSSEINKYVQIEKNYLEIRENGEAAVYMWYQRRLPLKWGGILCLAHLPHPSITVELIASS